MGSHHSHTSAPATDGGSSSGSGTSTPRGGSRRGTGRSGSSDSQAQEKPPAPSLVPIEKLAKLLVQKSQKEDGINGVTEKVLTKYVFPLYPELARYFHSYARRATSARAQHVPLAAFRTHCERLMVLLDDAAILEAYVRMFSADDEGGQVKREGVRALLHTCYKLSMDHYPEGPQTCLKIHQTLSAVVDGCFGKADTHSVGFVVRWLQENCPRLILPVHRYCVHTLATRHRELEAHIDGNGDGAGLELATPVLERSAWDVHGVARGLLPVSVAWLLAGALPPLYSRPHAPPAPPPHDPHRAMLASAAWVARLVCALPSHWVLLYTSREHGLGANRFLHHTLGYRGPTLILVQGGSKSEGAGAGGVTMAVASAQEWRESHQYWGNNECALLQVFPVLAMLERAPKMLYLNTSIRGYPRGLRAGSDPRKPLLSIHEDFEMMEYRGTPYSLDALEVWGCGDTASRETQLEIKKWQIKEAERQRQVKLSPADWMEHPDRYLLELAGRPQYNNSAS
ncbi:hypothetical protein EVAR_14548_1 [Eumeta japonica]|uniref:TLDc domain-containing protein n=1 Tax=Eumeta variegata TaxID=151549 RepID=A0A4C1U3C2_EUMVA|nr:hypothetical protein EVAR_14548_1 [Eumeta japonica]